MHLLLCPFSTITTILTKKRKKAEVLPWSVNVDAKYSGSKLHGYVGRCVVENLGSICTAQSPVHNILTKKRKKGGTNKSEWCKRSWKVSNWAIWKRSAFILLHISEISKIIVIKGGEREVVGVFHVNDSQHPKQIRMFGNRGCSNMLQKF